MHNPALPGNIKLGGFVLGGSVPAYNTNTSSSGRHGFYVVADQAVATLGARSEGRQVGCSAAWWPPPTRP